MINTAFVFPGQGSQSIGMLAQLAASHCIIIETFAEVSEVLGYDLWQLVQEGPVSKLNQTEFTQVAMLVADVAIYRLLQKMGFPEAKMMAGHSLGEYAALVCAEAISLPDAAQLVTKRGQLMQQKVPLGEGAMAAIIGLSDKQVTSICLQVCDDKQTVSPANYNAIGQVVIAGHVQAVEKALARAEEQGAMMAKLIPVSVPCHCSLLTDAAAAFEAYLAQANFKVPKVPVISNVDLSFYSSAAQIRTLLKEQLYQPVRWVETIQLMKKNNIQILVECGPGKVLSGLAKRIERDLPAISVNNNASLDQALGTLSLSRKEI